MTLKAKMKPKNVIEWSVSDIISWLTQTGHGDTDIIEKFRDHDIDGKALLTLKEEDLKGMWDSNKLKIGVIKRLVISIKQIQRENIPLLLELGYVDVFPSQNFLTLKNNDVSTCVAWIFFGNANDNTLF